MQPFNSLATVEYLDKVKVSLYDLSLLEQNMVKSWRSLHTEGCTITITVKEGRPAIGREYYENYIQRVPPPDNELSDDEIGIIRLIKDIVYGSITLTVRYGIPHLILGDTFKQIDFSKEY